jgi:SAM-dependent methyltransferase
VTADISTAEAEAWLRSWDRQQEVFMPDRGERLGFLVDLIVPAGGGEPRVVDLACGPGTLTSRLRTACPGAEVVAVDLDPILLSIYRGVHPGIPVVEVDLREASWTAALAPGETFDAVMTATALHWMPPQAVSRLYRDLAGLLRPGGVFVNADHAPLRRTPGLAARCETVADRERSRLTGTRLDWKQWWDAVEADPVLGTMFAERTRRFANRGEEFSPVESWHLKALRDAGFSESAVVWRRGRDAIVAACR